MNHNVRYHVIKLAFPVDIGRKPASPAHGSWQRLHDTPVTHARRLMKWPIEHGGARMERFRFGVTIQRHSIAIVL